MNIIEHNNNVYTKEKTDLEKYLLRVIQRYFDIENNYSKESIEAMIVESMTRFKRDIVNEKGFLFSLNQRSGNINLTINDFGGEPKFNKNNAFNKDFGIDADTVCDGNDRRLSDKREPLDHTHLISQINGLKDILDGYTIAQGTHIHDNKDVLDKINYTGDLKEFDLQLLEQLEERINDYCSNMQYHRTGLSTFTQKEIEILDSYKTQIQQEISNTKLHMDKNVAWLDDAKTYAKNNADSYYNKQLPKLNGFMLKSKITSLENCLKAVRCMVYDKEIPIDTNGTLSFVPVKENMADILSTPADLKNIFDDRYTFDTDNEDEDINVWEWNTDEDTFEYIGNVDDFPRILNTTPYLTYSHFVNLSSTDADDDSICVVLAYDKDTDSDISLVCTGGDEQGVTTPGEVKKPTASIYYNYRRSDAKKLKGYELIDSSLNTITRNADGGSGWKAITNGINVLVKKDKRRIKIWFSYTDIWQPSTDGDIHNTTAPRFNFSLDDFDETREMGDKTYYGYGNCSQTHSLYKNIYFYGIKYETKYPIGHTNIREENIIQDTIPNNILTDNRNIGTKMFFKFEEDGVEHQYPLPYYCKDDDNIVLVQGGNDKDGKITVYANLISQPSIYASQNNLYKDNLIALSDKLQDTFASDAIGYTDGEVTVCKIDSVDKENFIKTLLKPDEKCMFQGVCMREQDDIISYKDFDYNDLEYINIPVKPILDDIDSFYGSCLCYSIDNKMEILKEEQLTIPILIEYKVIRLSEYFDNPRIYYQVFGNKEGM